ncbi:hypothetical protein [Bradyrhizobium sp. ORS 111]|uniref:hypothetical protein n=1 Tax=Bradyrhizobium sp. ORS 111 TaxID=1685958 RepID=UPI00388EB1E7
MSLRLVKAAAESENDDNLHLARLLLLLGSADARKTTAITKARAVEGITKLAKMDFLLRYPTCLERILVALNRSHEDVSVHDRERTSIESKMIRFRYGPWDVRYRRWLGLLSSRGLVRLAVEGNTIVIGLTDAGRALAESIKTDPLFAELAHRSDITVKAVGSMSATRLKDFVYEAVPEITTMKWGDEIAL